MICKKCGTAMTDKIASTGEYICWKCETDKTMAEVKQMLVNEEHRETGTFLRKVSDKRLLAEVKRRKLKWEK